MRPQRQKFGAYLDAWVEAARGDVRGSTWLSYPTIVNRYVGARLGGLPLQEVTRAALKTHYAEPTASGGRNGGPLKAKTVHNIHLVLHRALKDAVEDHLIPKNPADGAHRIPARSTSMKTWTATELAIFLHATKGSQLYPLWRLAATTGMRRGELLGARWRDTDLYAPAIQVQQQYVRGGEGLDFGPPKTERGLRRIDLDADTASVLREHRRAQITDRLAFGPSYADGDLVFAHADGTPLDPDVVTDAFAKIVRSVDVPVIRLHDLRHTHATLGLAAGIHPKVMQERLGHASVSITIDTYSHAIPSMQADAASRIAAMVDGARADFRDPSVIPEARR